MEPPKNIKDVQSLTGRVAALNRFVSKAIDKCLPFFRILRKAFEWTDECQRAFEDLSHFNPTTEPVQTRRRVVSLLSSVSHAISSALIREEGKIQKPTYYTSKALKGAKGRYPPMEKLAFSLVIVARKLKPYFQAHVINVLTDHPLKKAMNKLEAVEQLIQWAMELSEFDVWYKPREAIKSQFLADLIVEFTPANNQQDGDQRAKQWVVHVDG